MVQMILVAVFIIGFLLLLKVEDNLLMPGMFIYYFLTACIIGTYKLQSENKLVLMSIFALGGIFYASTIYVFYRNFNRRHVSEEFGDGRRQNLKEIIFNKENLNIIKVANLILLVVVFISIIFLLFKRGTPLLTPYITKIEVGIGYGVIYRIVLAGFPIVNLINALVLLKRPSIAYGFYSLVTLITSILFLHLLGYKSYVLQQTLCLLFLIAILYRFLSRNSKIVIMVIVVLLVAISFSSAFFISRNEYRFQGLASNGSEIIESLYTRLTAGSMLGVDEEIRDVHSRGFYWGQTFLWDIESGFAEVTQELIIKKGQISYFQQLSDRILGKSTPYSVSITLLGDFYANMGLPGVAVAGILFALLFAYIENHLFRKREYDLNTPFVIYFLFVLYLAFSTGSFFTIMFTANINIIIMYILFMLIYKTLELPQRKYIR